MSLSVRLSAYPAEWKQQLSVSKVKASESFAVVVDALLPTFGAKYGSFSGLKPAF
jgi:hypothetical protein